MKTQWQRYKELELLPDKMAEPQAIQSPLMVAFNRHWRSLLNQRVQRLDYEAQVEYLEQRLTLTCVRSSLVANLWRTCWHLLNQPLRVSLQASTRTEPEIRRTLDQSGQAWWKVYDPMTGHTAYLESESDVQVWLEERLYSSGQ